MIGSRVCEGCDGTRQLSGYEMLRYDPRTKKWLCTACKHGVVDFKTAPNGDFVAFYPPFVGGEGSAQATGG